MDMTVEKTKARISGLKEDRLIYENKWRDIEDYISPGTTACYEEWNNYKFRYSIRKL